MAKHRILLVIDGAINLLLDPVYKVILAGISDHHALPQIDTCFYASTHGSTIIGDTGYVRAIY